MQITRQNTQALIIDIQEKLFPHIYENDSLLKNILKLIEGIKILRLPYLYNEQYPKGLGKTLPQIQSLLTKKPHEKITFSCAKNTQTLQELKKNDKNIIILFGIEAHVCVLQTALDLKKLGFFPVLVTDCIGSRKQEDKEIAIQRMIQEGIIPTTLESLLFELCQSARDESFKQISKLVK
jgi:nicotinamidase-related amidase